MAARARRTRAHGASITDRACESGTAENQSPPFVFLVGSPSNEKWIALALFADRG